MAKTVNSKDLLTGGVLQCFEAATLGMPLEVWKTHMGTYRKQNTMESFWNIYRNGGVAGFWKGIEPKLIESFLKGGILLFSKEATIKGFRMIGTDEVSSGVIGGFVGGVMQVTILGPCSFLVTAAVTGDKSVSITQRAIQTYQTQGIGGFYRGGTALALRQGSSWAMRQGFTDYTRVLMKKYIHNDINHKLTIVEEAMAAVIGGGLSVCNQPFEVMRIEAQSRATKGLSSESFMQTFHSIVTESGYSGLFKGVAPRMGICIWQTLLLVTVPKLLKPYGF